MNTELVPDEHLKVVSSWAIPNSDIVCYEVYNLMSCRLWVLFGLDSSAS